VRVDGPADLLATLTIRRNGEDVTDGFAPQGGALIGLVDGLALGKNELAAIGGSTGPPLAHLAAQPDKVAGAAIE
jgi:hypothetical protein